MTCHTGKGMFTQFLLKHDSHEVGVIFWGKKSMAMPGQKILTCNATIMLVLGTPVVSLTMVKYL